MRTILRLAAVVVCVVVFMAAFVVMQDYVRQREAVGAILAFVIFVAPSAIALGFLTGLNGFLKKLNQPRMAPPVEPAPSPPGKANKTVAPPDRYVVVDTETTGLRADTHEIIEIGALKVDRAARTESTYQVLVKPKRKVPAKITEITGITQAMIDAEGVPSDVALDGLVAFIEDARLVMYNAPFDQAFLAALAARHGKSLQNPVSDALDMARRAFPGLPSYKLGNVAMSIGVTPNGKHRAAADCGMTKAVYETAVATLGTVD